MLYSPQPMHIPNGFLSTLVSIVLWALSAGAVAYALRRVGKDLGERQVPLMGVLAATIFAGQMLNFTVTGGTSGHLLGAAIATILLGPWAAIIIMTSVVSIQALVFQDGGLLEMGANIFNMAVIGVAVSYFIYASLRKLLGEKTWAIFVSGAVAAWSSVVAAALAAALELAFSGTSPANIAVPAMGGIHALIGIGEALSARWHFFIRHDATYSQADQLSRRVERRSGASVWELPLSWRSYPRWLPPIPMG
jgi:cobalt/nickel transport system permease protein